MDLVTWCIVHLVFLLQLWCSTASKATEFNISAELGFEERLVVELLNRPTLTVRPTVCYKCPDGAVNVNITYNVIQILALSQAEETFSISGWFTTTWNDYRLMWNPNNHGDVTQVFLPSSKLWIPDVGVMNGKSNHNFDFSTQSQSRLSVTYDGLVTWMHGVILDVTCPLNVSYFPFDYQTCYIVLTPWQSHVHQLLIKPVQHGSTVDNSYLPNSNVSEWEILKVDFHFKKYVSQLNVSYQYITISIKIKRQPLYFIILVIVPFSMLSLLACLIFTLNDTGDRLSVALSLVLSMTMYVVIVSTNAPRSMRTLPILCVYLLNQLGLLCVATVLAVIAQKMREYNPLTGLINGCAPLSMPPTNRTEEYYSPYFQTDHRSLHRWKSKASHSNMSSTGSAFRKVNSLSHGKRGVGRRHISSAARLIESAMEKEHQQHVLSNLNTSSPSTFRATDSPVPSLRRAWATAYNDVHKSTNETGDHSYKGFQSEDEEPDLRAWQMMMKSADPFLEKWKMSDSLDRIGLVSYLLLSFINAIICLIIMPRHSE